MKTLFEINIEKEPLCAKHAIFATKSSCQGKPRNTSKTRCLKIFLSVFRDWKVYPRGSRKLNRENLCITLATGPSTREQVATMSRETHENPDF